MNVQSIEQSTISKAFGGDVRHKGTAIFTSPHWKRGLMLFGPTWIDVASDKEGQTFHTFVSTSHSVKRDAKINYVGSYTKVLLLQTHIEWSLLPSKCQQSKRSAIATNTFIFFTILHKDLTYIKAQQLREPTLFERPIGEKSLSDQDVDKGFPRGPL
ncbi:hypothetical protein EDB83DRAFT_2322898 [Lactarius deliciosus]|nr:hypothetical protein EDB83DRAFT_2322898 [Lactarius deliciosus]